MVQEIFYDMKKGPASASPSNVGEKIRTPGLLVRSQTLYPAELRPHMIELSLLTTLSILSQTNCDVNT